jgi:hypothetical protein
MKTYLKQIEVDILIGLSDFIPRNQNQITDLIGKNHDNSTDRVHVHRALKNLGPYLERAPNQLDDPGKKWTIRQHIETTRQIVENYEPLVLYFQKSQIVINQLFVENKILNHPPEIRGFFENIIQFSPTFLKMILVRKYFDNFKKTWLEFNPTQTYTAELIDLLVYLELAKHSILTDGLEGNDMQKAINYITEKKNDFPYILPSIAISSAFSISCIIKNLLGYSSKGDR